MKISRPTPVTTSSMTAESWSTWRANGTWKLPTENQLPQLDDDRLLGAPDLDEGGDGEPERAGHGQDGQPVRLLLDPPLAEDAG